MVLALVLGAGCSASRSDQPVTSSGGNGGVGAEPSLTRVPPASRKPAPMASGTLLGSSQTVSTADYAGKVLVLNVWGSWCPPCRKEAPELQAASVATARTAQFLGINSKETDQAQPVAFVRTAKITYPSIYDPDSRVLLNFAGNLPLSQFPSTLVIDQQGRVAARIIGPTTKSTLVGLVDDVAAGK